MPGNINSDLGKQRARFEEAYGPYSMSSRQSARSALPDGNLSGLVECYVST